eukprot:3510138-Prymnesium_polylepis.1
MQLHEARQEIAHARAATWQHRGQRRRQYVRAPWPSVHKSSSTHSDTESDGGLSESSCSGMKRTFTETSDCSTLEEEQQGGSGGTWPRALKRSNSSQRSLTEC